MRLTAFFGVLFLTAAFGITNLSAAGAHVGEASKLDVKITFLDPEGYTTSDGSGTYFNMFGEEPVFRPLVYPSLYWDTVPAYWGNGTMNFTVTLSNTADKGGQSFKVKVEAITNALNTNGTLGGQLGDNQSWTVTDLKPGQSVTVSGSITFPDEYIEPGLDVTRIRVSHLNNGDNSDAGLIKVGTGVWCPPPASNG